MRNWRLCPAASQSHFATVYTFSNVDPRGLTFANGVFYGVDTQLPCGAVFQFQPPTTAGGTWTQTSLYAFVNGNNDGCSSEATPVVAANGTIYGVTVSGGAYAGGTAYQVKPPTSPGGSWTETVVYNFNQQVGGPPLTGEPSCLILGPKGSLYVTTEDGGTAGIGSLFRLQPPHPVAALGPAPPSIVSLAREAGNLPVSLTHGPSGALYSTTEIGGTAAAGAGTVYELLPPTIEGGAWAGSELYSFQGESDGSDPNSVTLGPDGSLYGTTFGRTPVGENGDGTVYHLTPPSSPGAPWTKTVLYDFGARFNCGPDSPLILHDGNLYGATCLSEAASGLSRFCTNSRTAKCRPAPWS